MPLLDDYIAQLATVHQPADLHGPHADWIWEQCNQVAAAAADLNQQLGLAGPGQFQSHILTTWVGDASGILFVSANPGWSLKPNKAEDRFRRESIEKNREFCSDFFTVFPRVVGANPWWTYALRLAHLVREGAPPEGQPMVNSKQLWAWAQAGGLASGVGNVDLVPFHSSSDKFGTLQGANLNSAQQTLLNVATATLEMVLRLRPVPELTFVGSGLGARVMDRLCQEQNMTPWETPAQDEDDRIWRRLRRWVHPQTGAKVMTFPYQVCAGNAAFYLPKGFRVPLAERMREFMDEPVA